MYSILICNYWVSQKYFCVLTEEYEAANVEDEADEGQYDHLPHGRVKLLLLIQRCVNDVYIVHRSHLKPLRFFFRVYNPQKMRYYFNP